MSAFFGLSPFEARMVAMFELEYRRMVDELVAAGKTPPSREVVLEEARQTLAGDVLIVLRRHRLELR